MQKKKQEARKNQGKAKDLLLQAAAEQVAQNKQKPPQEPEGQESPVMGYMQERDVPKIKVNAIGREELDEAITRLKRYMQAKMMDDQRIVENEQWWKLMHWKFIRAKFGKKEKEPVEPTSAWLLNCLMNKHADAMDNYPQAIVLPREKGDQEVAKTMTSVLPLTLERCDYEQTYDRTWWYKLKSGTCVTGVFWQPSKDNGVGDIEIRKVDVLKLFAEPSVNDIQESDHLYCVDVMTMDQLKDRWGDKVKDYNGGSDVTVMEFQHDDNREQEDRVMVVDWYYKKRNANGRQVLHLCKFVGDTVLFASENPPEGDAPDMRETGWYEHGMYPFVPDVLFPVEDSWLGFGYVDVMRNPQMYIDRLDSLILRNAERVGQRRMFMSTDSGVNKEQFKDWSIDVVDVEGGINDTHIKEINVSPLPKEVYESRQHKIDELKETSGNRDFSQGGTTSGVTAASAIAALQEAGSKLSRDMIKSSYRSFRKICEMCIELYRQFYTGPRSFRVTGQKGEETFVTFDNRQIKPVQLQDEFGHTAYRKAIFDLSIKSQRSSPFSRVSQNELAKELFGMGIFNPEMADQALMLLDMMDFEGIEMLKQRISRNGTVYDAMKQQIAMLSQQLAALTGQMGMAGGMPAAQPMQPQPKPQPQKPASHDPMVQAVRGRQAIGPTTARDRAQDVQA